MAIGATRNVLTEAPLVKERASSPGGQERHCPCPGPDAGWQVAPWAERGCGALFYSLFGKHVCEEPGMMQRLSGLPVTRTNYPGWEECRVAGQGWAGVGEPPDAAQASLLTHLPHCLFLASQGPVEGAGCSSPWGRGKNSYQIPRC